MQSYFLVIIFHCITYDVRGMMQSQNLQKVHFSINVYDKKSGDWVKEEINEHFRAQGYSANTTLSHLKKDPACNSKCESFMGTFTLPSAALEDEKGSSLCYRIIREIQNFLLQKNCQCAVSLCSVSQGFRKYPESTNQDGNTQASKNDKDVLSSNSKEKSDSDESAIDYQKGSSNCSVKKPWGFNYLLLIGISLSCGGFFVYQKNSSKNK